MDTVSWQKRINTLAVLLSIGCVGAFFIFSFGPWKTETIFHHHPLMINVWLTIFTFFLGLIGFSGVTNGKRYVMSIATLLITLLISVILLFLLIIGRILL